MSAHTPGPWGVVNGKHETRVISGPVVGRVVAHVVLEREANARLIAAAPELLEALHALVKVASVCIPETAGHELEQARAAIAKAEGRS